MLGTIINVPKAKRILIQHGYTSHGSYNLLSDQRFDKLHDAVVTQVEKYTNYHDINPSFHITNSWVSIYGHGHFAPEHIHPRSHLSCVFYGAATEGTGEIVLRNPAKPSYVCCTAMALHFSMTIGLYLRKLGK